MNVYVVGAGVSKTVGYPLGNELLREVDTFIRGAGSSLDRPDYSRRWSSLCTWLERNPDPVIAEAYRSGNLEYIFSALDFVPKLFSVRLNELARRRGGRRPATSIALNKDMKPFFHVTRDYAENRHILLWALEKYLERKHQDDQMRSKGSEWEPLRQFASRLREGDVVVTFNYDSTLERVLLQQNKWAPADGYGFRVDLWKSMEGESPVSYVKSAVTTLHLHGSVGWYYKLFRTAAWMIANERLSADERAKVIPRFFDEPIALDSTFLRRMGIDAVDRWAFADPHSQNRQVVLHPSFVKAFGPDRENSVFIHLWRRAAKALRAADRILVIGYSLPEADSGALSLLLTNCDGNRTRIVNPDLATSERLHLLLTEHWKDVRAESFQDWLARSPESF